MAQEQPYTKNPKLDRFITNMEHSIESIKETLVEHTMVHAQILEQTTTTNGKVASIQKWRERTNGGLVALIFLFPFLLGGLWWVSSIVLQDTIEKAVESALTVYEMPQ